MNTNTQNRYNYSLYGHVFHGEQLHIHTEKVAFPIWTILIKILSRAEIFLYCIAARVTLLFSHESKFYTKKCILMVSIINFFHVIQLSRCLLFYSWFCFWGLRMCMTKKYNLVRDTWSPFLFFSLSLNKGVLEVS